MIPRFTFSLVACTTGILFFGQVALSSSLAQTRIDPARAAEAVPTASSLSHDASSIASAASDAAAAGLDEENAFAPITPGDSDIGQQLILKREEKKQPFNIALDSGLFWSDNAANVSAGEIPDWFTTGGITGAWQHRLHARVYGDAYVSQHFYRYDDLDVLDYESGQAGLGCLILMPELANSIWHLHYTYQRITQGLDEPAAYQTHNLRGGVQKTFLIDRLNSFNTSLLASIALDAEPDILQRHQYSFQAGYKFKIMRDLILSLGYRFEYFDYFNLAGREDFYHSVSGNLSWRPRKFLELSANYNFAVNDSNLDFFDYEAQLAGPSLRVSFKF